MSSAAQELIWYCTGPILCCSGLICDWCCADPIGAALFLLKPGMELSQVEQGLGKKSIF